MAINSKKLQSTIVAFLSDNRVTAKSSKDLLTDLKEGSDFFKDWELRGGGQFGDYLEAPVDIDKLHAGSKIREELAKIGWKFVDKNIIGKRRDTWKRGLLALEHTWGANVITIRYSADPYGGGSRDIHDVVQPSTPPIRTKLSPSTSPSPFGTNSGLRKNSAGKFEAKPEVVHEIGKALGRARSKFEKIPDNSKNKEDTFLANKLGFRNRIEYEEEVEKIAHLVKNALTGSTMTTDEWEKPWPKDRKEWTIYKVKHEGIVWIIEPRPRLVKTDSGEIREAMIGVGLEKNNNNTRRERASLHHAIVASLTLHYKH
jgi:hypothetical protein